jgi:D-serine deaminase-like pyridoxal phosphate-dependent protein
MPFRLAFCVWSTVVSANETFAVCDAGLKSLGMDHGNPTIDGAKVWFCSDEHVTFARDAEASEPLSARVGDRVRVWPAHIDPTIAYHQNLQLVDALQVVEVWPIDLRGW